MATVAEGKIGDKKIAMSLLEPSAYINYQRIEDNLAVVRERYVVFLFLFPLFSLSLASTALSRFPRKSSTAISTTLSTRTLNVAPATSSCDRMYVLRVSCCSMAVYLVPPSALRARMPPPKYVARVILRA